MNTLLFPHLTVCRFGCGWEIPTASAVEKKRREDTHHATAHNSTEAVTGLVAADPIHARDAEEVVAAIELDASANSGEVDPNRVRHLIPSHVQAQVIGATYARLVREGRLVEIGWTTNRDKRGRNDGKPCRIYSMSQREAS